MQAILPTIFRGLRGAVCGATLIAAASLGIAVWTGEFRFLGVA